MNKPVKIHAAVRSQEQAQSFSQQELQVIVLDLGDKYAVVEYILSNDIQSYVLRKCAEHGKLTIILLVYIVDLVINNATSIDVTVALNLIIGLKARRETTGRDAFYIHVSPPC